MLDEVSTGSDSDLVHSAVLGDKWTRSLSLPVLTSSNHEALSSRKLLNHSYLRASSGSIFVARRAGRYDASRAVIDRIAAVNTKIAGSFGCTP